MTRIDFSHLTISCLFALALGACSLEPAEMGGDADNPYRQGFERINATPFTSELPGGSLIDVWVSNFAAVEYSKVLLDGQGSGVDLPVGTVIVREVLDDNMEIKTLTLMIKNDPGYFPEGGDWWYGVADPSGIIINDANGVPMMGQLIECGSCHASRASDGFLFGVPSGYH